MLDRKKEFGEVWGIPGVRYSQYDDDGVEHYFNVNDCEIEIIDEVGVIRVLEDLRGNRIEYPKEGKLWDGVVSVEPKPEPEPVEPEPEPEPKKKTIAKPKMPEPKEKLPEAKPLVEVLDTTDVDDPDLQGFILHERIRIEDESDSDYMTVKEVREELTKRGITHVGGKVLRFVGRKKLVDQLKKEIGA